MNPGFKLTDLRAGWATPRPADGALQPEYVLHNARASVSLNEHLEQGVILRRGAANTCVHCAAQSRRLYPGGYCYTCFSTLAACDLCVVNPARCHFHAGSCRQPEWGQQFCMQPHTVYLAVSSGPKVGITRHGREHERWRDQGASRALRIVRTPSRRAAGIVEDYLRGQLSDRTDWRRLVTGAVTQVDLAALAAQLQRDALPLAQLAAENPAAEMLAQLDAEEARAMCWAVDAQPTLLQHPLRAYSPAQRLSLAPGEEIADNVVGVLGQYLLLSRGVFNLRAHRGMDIDVELVPRISESELPVPPQASLF